MKSWALAARAAAITSSSGRIWPAEAQITGDGAVEQCRVLGDDRDNPAHLMRVEVTDVVSANADRAGLSVVLAQQQAEDGGFAGQLGPTIPTVSPAAIAKLNPLWASPRGLDRRTRQPRKLWSA